MHVVVSYYRTTENNPAMAMRTFCARLVTIASPGVVAEAGQLRLTLTPDMHIITFTYPP